MIGAENERHGVDEEDAAVSGGGRRGGRCNGIRFRRFLAGRQVASLAAGAFALQQLGTPISWRLAGASHALLEIDFEVGFYCLLAVAAGAAKHQIVLHGLVHRSRKIKVHSLIVRSFYREKSFRGAPVLKVAILILVKHQEVDIGGAARFPVDIADKRCVQAV